MVNPALGVLFHWLGGFASGSFYVPFRGVKDWSWETLWTIGGIFSWVIAPIVVGALLTNNLFEVLLRTPPQTLFWCFFFGLLWGFGGLTFGLTVRYLGLSLGTAMALGYCAAFGTLMPPIFRGEMGHIVRTQSGKVILAGIAMCLAGIVIAGAAGLSKERDLPSDQQSGSIREFNLRMGVVVATFCGIMSACFSYGLAAGDPIRRLTVLNGTSALWQGLPVLVVVLAGGFTTNFIWCVILHFRNRSGTEYFRTPLPRNYFLSALAGVIWYFQFFFYTMGETKMGSYAFSSWTLHMASIIIFGTLWGLALREWKGTGRRTRTLLAASIITLVVSTAVVGYGNYLAI
jgi:L-rhamnose-H+ transport protein